MLLLLLLLLAAAFPAAAADAPGLLAELDTSSPRATHETFLSEMRRIEGIYRAAAVDVRGRARRHRRAWSGRSRCRMERARSQEGTMLQIALIIICLAIGVLLRWSGRLPDTATKVMGGWVINVALPAAALRSVHGLSPHPDWWLAAATPWIGVIVAILLIVPLCRALGWSRQRCGALLLVGGWGNTSFVGLPMIAAFAGDEWIGLGIVIDLFGSYLALSTLGLAIAAIASAGRLDGRAVIRRIATFPPFLAILVALATNHLDRPEWLTQIFISLADTLTPIALAAVGCALRLDRLSGRLAALGAGLVFRLFVAPLTILALYVALGQASDPVAKVAMLEMAMPPMLGASIIAMDHDLEPDLVALLIGVGVPLSMLTAPAWWSVIGPL